MSDYKFGIEGLYDLRTAKKLKDFGLKIFSFDQRTRSPQFIQSHVLIEILKSEPLLETRIALKFDYDKSFMIDHLIEKIVAETSVARSQIEVWLYAENDWVNHASVPFRVYYAKETSPQKMIHHNNFAGFLFKASDFEHRDGGQDLQKIMLLLQLVRNRVLTHNLSLAPFDSFPHALVDYLGIETFLVEVNQDVEVCYRNLDYDKLSKCFNLLFKEIKSQAF